MKNLSIAILLLTSTVAFAQSSYNLQTDGRIQNSTSTYATVSGNGTSNSVAKGDATATAVGTVSTNPIAGGVSAVLTGTSTTTGSAMAFNVSTGSGKGTASSVGWSDSRVTGNVTSNVTNTTTIKDLGNNGNDKPVGHASGSETMTGNTSQLSISGSTDSGMTNPVRNGVDFGVVAGTSQDGYAASTSTGTFAISGTTSQLPITGGFSLANGLTSTQSSQSTAVAGAVTFSDGTPAGQSAAQRWSNGGTDVNVSGSFVNSVSNTTK